jgi:hypothetical protein
VSCSVVSVPLKAAVCVHAWQHQLALSEILPKKAPGTNILVNSLKFCRAGLHPEETQRMIDVGVNLMMKTAMRLVRRRRTATPTLLRIQDVVEGDEEDEIVGGWS